MIGLVEVGQPESSYRHEVMQMQRLAERGELDVEYDLRRPLEHKEPEVSQAEEGALFGRAHRHALKVSELDHVYGEESANEAVGAANDSQIPEHLLFET